MKNNVICDTNIISEYLKGNSEIISVIEDNIGVSNILITPIIYIELIRWLSVYKGLSPKERRGFKTFFDSLQMIHLNLPISKLSVEISQKKDSLEAADILIGATAIYHDIPIYTKNIKHFKQMQGIKLYE